MICDVEARDVHLAPPSPARAASLTRGANKMTYFLLPDEYRSYRVGGCVLQEEVMQQKVPRCPSCRGVVKPDITFFGEKLPGSVKRAVEADHKKVRRRGMHGRIPFWPRLASLTLVHATIPFRQSAGGQPLVSIKALGKNPWVACGPRCVLYLSRSFFREGGRERRIWVRIDPVILRRGHYAESFKLAHSTKRSSPTVLVPDCYRVAPPYERTIFDKVFPLPIQPYYFIQADLFLVLGTSLKVQPVSRILQFFPRHVPQVHNFFV